MKILYLTMAEIDETSGVYKKICAQCSAFRNLSYECDILFINDSGTGTLYKVNEQIILPFTGERIEASINRSIKEYELCYARFELLRHTYYKYALTCCNKNNIDIILEIPTYPPYQESLARAKDKFSKKNYKGALKTLLGTLVVIFDQYRLVRKSKVVCIIADNKKFLFRDTVRIENGVDIRKNPFSISKDDRKIRIIAVSNFAVWNGYDRAIKGLKTYVEKNETVEIELVFVGDKTKASDLIALTEKLNLEKYVKFTGALSGNELNKEYEIAHIGLGALGNHRRKVFANSSLKAKEYSSRGLPMIISDSEGIEKEIKRISYVASSDESPLDFNEVILWYRNKGNHEKEQLFIRQFAERHYSWEVQMKKVLNVYSKNK